MKAILITLSFFGVTAGLYSQPLSTAPAFRFVKEMHDFGEVEEGMLAEHDFGFVNTGKEPLIILRVDGGCSCTVPSWPKEPILPGQEGVIKVVYNTKGRPGNFHKPVNISSNAETPTKVIYIKGIVTKPKETN